MCQDKQHEESKGSRLDLTTEQKNKVMKLYKYMTKSIPFIHYNA